MKTRFYQLNFGEKFTLTGKILQKESTFRAVTSIGRRVEATVWPWVKVQLVEDHEVAKLCRDLRDIDTLVNGERDLGRTHYVGDGCLPPHEP